MNITAQLEFKLTYYEVTVLDDCYYPTESPPMIGFPFINNNESNLVADVSQLR